jgi:hypothetical protein
LIPGPFNLLSTPVAEFRSAVWAIRLKVRTMISVRTPDTPKPGLFSQATL